MAAELTSFSERELIIQTAKFLALDDCKNRFLAKRRLHSLCRERF